MIAEELRKQAKENKWTDSTSFEMALSKIKELELQILNLRAMLSGKTSLHKPKITKTN